MGRKPFRPGVDDAGVSRPPLDAIRREHATLAEGRAREVARCEHATLLRQFVHDHAGWLRKLTARLVGRSHADDVAQDAFVSLIVWSRNNPAERVTRVFGAIHELRPLMFRIAVCRAIDHARRVRSSRDDLPLDCDVGDPGAVERSQAGALIGSDLERVERAYRTLLPIQRIVHALHFYYGFSDADLEITLGITRTNCRTLIFRANRALRRAMEMTP